MQQRPGFTLIELLVVIGIIALLAAMSLPIIAMIRKQAKEALCRNNLQQIGIGITGFQQVNNNYFPQSLSQLLADGQPMHGENPKLLLCPFDAGKGTSAKLNCEAFFQNNEDITELYDLNHSNGSKTPTFLYRTYPHSYLFEAANVDLGQTAKDWGWTQPTWALAKAHQLKHGNKDALGNPNSAPFRMNDFPIVRCFWHYQWKPGGGSRDIKKVLNIAWDMSIFWSIPYWEHQANPNIPNTN
jgi:prepilin-type N-terminal cleavage/methylation domain-containing protein